MIVGGYTPQYELNELKELSEDFNMNSILKNNAYQSKALDFQTAYLLGIFALSPYKKDLQGIFNVDSKLAEKQSIAALCALHNQNTYKHEKAPEQIAGICAAIFDYDIRTSQNGFLEPDVDYAIDNCGMGGDLFRTPNVSTVAALIAAYNGISMFKHGSPGNTDSTGSSDFLKYCGVDLYSDKELVQRALELFNFSYTDALDTKYKSVHTQTHKSAHLAHMNDIIGPITNPLHPKLQKKKIIGINHLLEPKVCAGAYQILNEKGLTNLEHGLFVRGFISKDRNGGIDEVSVFEGGTSIAELKNGNISTYDLYAQDFGIGTQNYFETPCGKSAKAQFSRDILENKISGAPKNLILANVAVLEYLAKGTDFKTGFLEAKKVLESGAPARNFKNYINFIGGVQYEN